MSSLRLAVPARALPARAATADATVNLLAGLSWATALIHIAVIPEHWTEYKPFAVAFAVVALLEGAWSLSIFRGAGRRVLLAGAALSVGTAAVWALSRTTGLPVGAEPWTPEAAGVADVTCTAAELFLAVGAVRLARGATLPVWAARLGVVVLLAAGVGLTLAGHMG